MNFDQLFPGRFLKAGLFNGREPTLTITKVYRAELAAEGGGTEQKATIAFKETPKELVLCKTNGLCIREMFGNDCDKWVGKRVTFYAAEFEGQTCIRTRGSPDIAKDVTFDLKLARKRARKMTLKKTDASNASSAQVEAPPHDPQTGEVLEPPPSAAVA